MANPSPLHSLHDDADAVFTSFGDDVPIVAEYEAHEIEYAAMRKSAAVMDCPHRGLVELTGSDRTDFLQRMVSGNVATLQPGEALRCFLLSETGRIAADLLVMHTGISTLIELDACDAANFVAELSQFVFTEDVQITDLTPTHHCLAICGPNSPPFQGGAGGGSATNAPGLDMPQSNVPFPSPFPEGRGGADHVIRQDLGDIPGIHLWLRTERAVEAWQHITQAGGKPLGWQAFNIARIEAGKPLYHIDFGPTNLPHETGIVSQTCDFTKGCYRGQEIVARMQSLGHPKQLLVGFRAVDGELPPAGAAVFGSDDVDAPAIGAVTSSCHSPMKSDAAVGFAMVKWGRHEPGAALCVQTATGREAIVMGELKPAVSPAR